MPATQVIFPYFLYTGREEEELQEIVPNVLCPQYVLSVSVLPQIQAMDARR